MNEELLDTLKNAIADAAESGLPQQVELDTNHGKIVILVAKLSEE